MEWGNDDKVATAKDKMLRKSLSHFKTLDKLKIFVPVPPSSFAVYQNAKKESPNHDM
jgi:hypothetical protein